MLIRFWTYLQYGNRFCGIEHTTRNGEDIIYGSILKKSGKELNTELTFEVKTIDDLSKKLNRHQHLVLAINNDKVLSKAIENEQDDVLKLVYKAFPNINLDDFYFEILSQKNRHFITLCRKDYVNSLIEAYSKLKLSIIDISLGNNLIGNISSFLSDERICSSNSVIKIENSQVTQIKKDNVTIKDYDINGLTISNLHLLSFSGALQTVLKSSSTKSNFFAEKEHLITNYKQTRFFNLSLKLGGLFILVLLLINFFVFNYYFNKVNDLKQISEINQSTKSKIAKLINTVSKKQKMVDDLLRSETSKSSFYCDIIIHSLPSTILLSEFNYQPLLKRIKPEKNIELKENSIIILGSSNNSEDFSNWIGLLEKKKWINKIDIIEYGVSSPNTSDFKINIIFEK